MSIIRTVQLDTRNEPLVPLAEKVLIDGVTTSGDTYGINVDAPYQRAPVWGDDRKRNLIRSLLMGLPIGALIFNERAWPEWRVCVDGKQRLLAVRSFIDGDLDVPAGWFSPEHVDPAHTWDGTVDWNGLTARGRRMFDSCALCATHTAHIRSDAAGIARRESELFDLINYGGVPQGESDLT